MARKEKKRKKPSIKGSSIDYLERESDSERAREQQPRRRD